MNIANIKKHIRALKQAKAALNAAVALTWPIDADIHWDKGGHRQYGRVKGHGGIGRCGEVRVCNERTEKEYWITMYDVVGYVE